jgi:hypothetical protein
VCDVTAVCHRYESKISLDLMFMSSWTCVSPHRLVYLHMSSTWCHLGYTVLVRLQSLTHPYVVFWLYKDSLYPCGNLSVLLQSSPRIGPVGSLDFCSSLCSEGCETVINVEIERNAN